MQCAPTVKKIEIQRRFMTYNPDIHNRKSIRLKNYDYSKEGLYFITICVKNNERIFGEFVGTGSSCPNDNLIVNTKEN